MYLFFDIGGTRSRSVVSEDGRTLGEVRKCETPERFEDIFENFSDYKDMNFDAVIGGVAGVFDKDKDTLLKAPNLPGWEGKSIKKAFQDYFNTPSVYLENDANLAALGEACYGAGKGYGIVSYITVSTGIGGARIVDGKIDSHLWGFEPGHQIIDVDSSIWPESKNFDTESLTQGSISSYISGSALAERYGKEASELKDPAIWDEVERLLAVGLYNTIVHWSPEVIVLGGGMVLEDAVSIEKVRENLKKLMKIFPDIPEIKKAELGDRNTLFGCLSLAGK